VKLAIDSLAAQKWAGLLFLFLGVFWWLLLAISDTRGAPYRFWNRYVSEMDTKLQSMFIWTNVSYIATVQAVVGVTLYAGYVLMGELPFAFGALLAISLPTVVISVMASRRRKQIDDQVAGFTITLANALKSTASIGDALQSAIVLTPKPLLQELELALKQMRLGSSLPDALLAMTARAQVKSLDICVSALLVGRQSGGDLPTILERTSASLRELKRLEDHTNKTLRSSKQGFVMSLMITFGLLFYLPKVMPAFFAVYKTTKGQLVLSQMVLVFCLTCYLAYRFTRTDI
jgi:tight adherence protein B